MEKKLESGGIGLKIPCHKAILAMKLTCFLMCCLLFNVQAAVKAQGQTVSLKLEQVSVAEAIRQLKEQTQLDFFFSNKQVDVDRKVSLDLQDIRLDEALKMLLGESYSYEFLDDMVVIKPIEETILVAPQESVTLCGKVVDENGLSLPGVAVLLKGTTIGAATDIDGNFRLTVPRHEGMILVFSFVGMKTQEISASEHPMHVVMKIASEEIDEVVVMAYGTQLKRNVTGSVAKVSDFTPEKTQVGNVITGLQGKVAGLWIRKLHGSAGASPEFVIRGYQTNNLNNQPLIVIDGMIVDSKDNFNLNNIAPQDIESIEILKDAASSAMYGSRGAMGVIQITTKKGTLNQKPIVNLSAYYGIVKTPFHYRMLNTSEYEMLFREGRENRINDIKEQIANGKLTEAQKQTLKDEIALYQNEMSSLNMGRQEVDWLDECVENHVAKNDVHMSLSGGNDKTIYYFSLGRTYEENSVGKGTFTRLTTKLSLSNQTYKWLKIGANIAVTRSTKKNFIESMTVLGLTEVRPDTPREPKYDKDGNWDYYWGEQYHPLLALSDDDNKDETTNVTGNFSAEIKPIKGLVWTSTVSGTLSHQKTESYSSPQSYNGIYDNGTYNESGNNGHRITANSFFNYTIDFGLLNINATLGYEYNENQYKSYAMNIIGFSGIEGLESPTNGSEFSGDEWLIPANTSNLERSESYFFRANLAYNQKYLFSFSVRRDGSSKLAKENRYSNFPALSMGWIISDETFMKKSKYH